MAKVKLTRKEMLEGLRHLSEDTTTDCSGFYKRLVSSIESADSKSTDKFWSNLESKNFTDIKQLTDFLQS